MDARRTIEERVEDGCVLNSEGQWVHMFQQLTDEQHIIEELARGNVRVNGIWVRIADAKKWARAPRTPGTVPPSHPPQIPVQLAPVAKKASISPATVPLTPAPHTDRQPEFNPEDNFLETIAMDASALKQIAGSINAGSGRGANTNMPHAPAPLAAKPVVANPPVNTDADETDSFDPGLINADAPPPPISINTNSDDDADFSGGDDFRETALLTLERLPPRGQKG
ncbi:MAG: hypothetical protein FWC23_05765 [Chitinispirillia bacterium]|nr:hypothetical protein [Chitinispirillia bacterium]MCL2268674.1 hypothetical protein [Chitinispirillia bacterium]